MLALLDLAFFDRTATQGTPKGDTPSDEVSSRQMERYLAKLSDPLIDRIDLHVEVPPVPYRQLSGARSGTTSAQMRERVIAARERQTARSGSTLKPNGALTGRELDQVVVLEDPAKELLRQAMTELGLSARAYDKIRRLSRTIADLDASDAVRLADVAEAIQYRLLDRKV